MKKDYKKQAEEIYNGKITKDTFNELKKDKKLLFAVEDKATQENSLWKRLNANETNDISEDSFRSEFLKCCFQENLNHARHVENERLTFNSIYLALVGGVVALVGNLEPYMQVGLLTFLAVAGVISMLLTKRWNNTFDRHMYFAKKCYQLMHIELFGRGNVNEKYNFLTEEKLEDINEPAMFAFRIRNGGSKIRTKKLYNAFYYLIEGCVVGLDIYYIITGLFLK